MRTIDEDALEQAFWDYDANRRKMSDRDAFKGVVRKLLLKNQSHTTDCEIHLIPVEGCCC
jgi:hypothetical protein